MDPDRRSQVSARTVWTVGLNIFAMALAAYFVYRVREVLAWILVALFLAVAVNPGVAWLEGKGLKRGWAVLVIAVIGMGLLVLLGFILVPPLVEQGRALVGAAPDLLEKLRGNSVFRWADERLGVIERSREWARVHAAGAAESLFGIITGFFRGLVALATVVVLTIFMLLFGGDVRDLAMRPIEPSRRSRYLSLVESMQKAVGGYVAGIAMVALIAGVVTTLYLLVLGVPYFLPLGLVALLLDMIPFIGNTVTGFIIVPTAFAVGGTRTGIIVMVVFLVYQQVENHLVQPLIQRRTVSMNPLIIVLVLLIGTSLAGILGALLAIPVAGAAQVLIRDVMARNGDASRPGGAGGR